ncbi:MAG: arylsulfatase [Bryobacteraceae bacterium]|nr:arylsulfatase [Bryobacteraceae bacterium]
MQARRDFLATALVAPSLLQAQAKQPPNIVLIITDDQGTADLGSHGNPHLRTPHLDRLAKQSVEFTNFCVSPLCAPTRASLMTGRYYYRTGVTDTYQGQAIMDPRERTIAEMLREAGYATGIFGKWHLGDCYPTRPIDKGFAEALVHLGGGLAQPSAPEGGGDYDNPMLQRNGQWERAKGYCTDIFANETIAFIERHQSRPFFAYLATNAPHSPYDIAAKYSQPYLDKGLPEKVAKIYGMIENIDDNVGRILKRLDELKLAERTIFIFMTDNGATNAQYTAGLRNLKGTVYEGGIRTPFFWRGPGAGKPGKVDRMAAMIDITPTLLEVCGIKPKLPFDGKSLAPLLQRADATWEDRKIFLQIHRGDTPVLYRNFCVRTDRWKLLHAVPIGKPLPAEVKLELYDLKTDPGEKTNLIQSQPAIAAQLKASYEAWFGDVTTSRGFAAVRFIAGTRHENPLTLTRQDWRGPKADWDAPNGIGHWEIVLAGQGAYDVVLRFPPFATEAEAEVRLGSATQTVKVPAGAKSCRVVGLKPKLGEARVETILRGGGVVRGAHYVDIAWRA